MDAVQIEVVDAACTIWLNRPDGGNLLTVPDIVRLTQALRTAADNPATRVVLLRGRGADFCRGRDHGPRDGTHPTAAEQRERVIEPILAVYAALRETPVPVMALVQGAAFGFGCALAAGCDMTLAAAEARFALTELRGGIPPTLALSALQNRVAPQALSYMVFTTEEVDAATAAAWGLASRVVAAAALDAEAARLVEGLSSRAPAALARVKQFLLQARHLEPKPAADLAADLLVAALSGS